MPAPIIAALAWNGARMAGSWLLRRAFTSAAANGARTLSTGRTLGTTATVADVATGGSLTGALIDAGVAALQGDGDPAADGSFPVMETMTTLASLGLAALNPSVLTFGIAAAVTTVMATSVFQAAQQPNEPAPAPA